MKCDRTLIATKRGYVAFPCYFLQSNGLKQREIQTLRKHEHATVILLFLVDVPCLLKASEFDSETKS